eukprot:gnl/MRDRNA2_/MRDRNA2_20494_c0_seq1.p3 gnl/MRDRNA2_/MRDRNA2_20494_c0~~gnl/MRDRNA2_/MRDRNA2_20494_c0_seq1.p3  ORF type:complete len:102 (-),score=10.37 gnl/MRDRNA2_/MRDRNA2_20494_c0_seq1:59-364(-)
MIVVAVVAVLVTLIVVVVLVVTAEELQKEAKLFVEDTSASVLPLHQQNIIFSPKHFVMRQQPCPFAALLSQLLDWSPCTHFAIVHPVYTQSLTCSIEGVHT